jgi:hypothetical protein
MEGRRPFRDRGNLPITQVEGKLREKYGRGEFEQAMDVAQLIYI